MSIRFGLKTGCDMLLLQVLSTGLDRIVLNLISSKHTNSATTGMVRLKFTLLLSF
jgi:hypothetical protein